MSEEVTGIACTRRLDKSQCFCAPEVGCEDLVYQSCCPYETEREDAGSRDLQSQLCADHLFSFPSCLAQLHVTQQRVSR